MTGYVVLVLVVVAVLVVGCSCSPFVPPPPECAPTYPRPTHLRFVFVFISRAQGLNPSKALEIFEEMKREGVRPTVVTFSALISACEKVNKK